MTLLLEIWLCGTTLSMGEHILESPLAEYQGALKPGIFEKLGECFSSRVSSAADGTV
jgi:hypothetical protein